MGELVEPIGQIIEISKAGSAAVVAGLVMACLYLVRELRALQAKHMAYIEEQKDKAERRAERAEELKAKSTALAEQMVELYQRLDNKLDKR